MKGEFTYGGTTKYEAVPEIDLRAFDEIAPYLDLGDMTYVNRIGNKDDLYLEELKKSIMANTLLNPPIVIEKGSSYIKVAGFRRLDVMYDIWSTENKQAELKMLVRVLPKDTSEETLKSISIEENECRRDLKKIEVIRAFSRDDKTMSTEQVMKIYGINNRDQLYMLRSAAKTLDYIPEEDFDEMGITKIAIIKRYIEKLEREGKKADEIKELIQNIKNEPKEEIRKKVTLKESKNNILELKINYTEEMTEEEIIQKVIEAIKSKKSN